MLQLLRRFAGPGGLLLILEACRLSGGKEGALFGTLDAAYWGRAIRGGHYDGSEARANLRVHRGRSKSAQQAEDRWPTYRARKPYLLEQLMPSARSLIAPALFASNGPSSQALYVPRSRIEKGRWRN